MTCTLLYCTGIFLLAQILLDLLESSPPPPTLLLACAGSLLGAWVLSRSPEHDRK